MFKLFAVDKKYQSTATLLLLSSLDSIHITQSSCNAETRKRKGHTPRYSRDYTHMGARRLPTTSPRELLKSGTRMLRQAIRMINSETKLEVTGLVVHEVSLSAAYAKDSIL